MVDKLMVDEYKPIDFNAFYKGVDEKTQLPNAMLYSIGNDIIKKNNYEHKDNPIKTELKAEAIIEAGRISILQGRALSEILKHKGLTSQVNMSALMQNPISLAEHPNALANLEAEVDRVWDIVEGHCEAEDEELSIVDVACDAFHSIFSRNKDCHAKNEHKPYNNRMKELAEKAKHGKHEHDENNKCKGHDAKDENLGHFFPNLYGAPCAPKKHEQQHQQ